MDGPVVLAHDRDDLPRRLVFLRYGEGAVKMNGTTVLVPNPDTPLSVKREGRDRCGTADRFLGGPGGGVPAQNAPVGKSGPHLIPIFEELCGCTTQSRQVLILNAFIGVYTKPCVKATREHPPVIEDQQGADACAHDTGSHP